MIQSEKLDFLTPEGCNDKGTMQSMNCRSAKSDGTYVDNNNNFMLTFGSTPRVEKILRFAVKPLLAKWANITLGDTMIAYGIRRYTRGAKLWSHVDRLPSHLISAILQVLGVQILRLTYSLRSEAPWPILNRSL